MRRFAETERTVQKAELKTRKQGQEETPIAWICIPLAVRGDLYEGARFAVGWPFVQVILAMCGPVG